MYQVWAIGIRWAEARRLPRTERRLMLVTLALTRGMGLVLGLLLIGGALWRAAH